MASSYVLDAYALMAFLRDEPGGGRVHDLLAAAAKGDCVLRVTCVNWGEVLYQVERRWGEAQLNRVIAHLDALPIQWVPVDHTLATAAAHVKAGARLSYADAFAVALAQATSATIVTGDPEFTAVADLVRIEWLP